MRKVLEGFFNGFLGLYFFIFILSDISRICLLVKSESNGIMPVNDLKD